MLRSSGLNTVLDPDRLKQGNRENGFEVEFSQAVNVAVDERGLTSLRDGSVELGLGVYHSLFCKNGDCFVVKERETDAAIMQVVSVQPELVLAGVRSGLTKNQYMAWDQSGGDTFYSNGQQTGYIRDGASYPWPVQTYYGPSADMQFLDSGIAATHIAFLSGGQVLVASGNAVFSNHLPFQYGLFHQARGNVVTLEQDITMVAAVHSGFFVSDGKSTWFMRRTDEWYQFKQEPVSTSGAVSFSLAHEPMPASDVTPNVQGFARVWLSTDGVCAGFDDGSFLNLTSDRVKLPVTEVFGASLNKDSTVMTTSSTYINSLIVSVWTDRLLFTDYSLFTD